MCLLMEIEKIFKTMHFPLKPTKNGNVVFILCICPVISNSKKYEMLSNFEFLIAIHLTINISKIGVDDIKCFKLVQVGVL